MSDRDKFVVLGLFFIFLISFFVLFILFGHEPDSKLFQYMFLIAALTMAFTGFLGATGTFTTQGQTLGGGAAIFLVMVVAVVGLKPYFATDNYMLEIVEIAKSKSNSTEDLSTEVAVKRVEDAFEKIQEMRHLLKMDSAEPLEAMIPRLKASLSKTCSGRETLTMVIRSLEAPHKIFQTSDGKFKGYLGNNKLVETKEGKYEFPMAELQREMIFMEKLSKNIKLDNVILEYHDDIPELQLYVKEEK